MFLSDIAIRRPVFTLMVSVAMILFGAISYTRLPVDQFPPVEFPILVIQTVWPGASPADLERDVTRDIEDAVASVPGLDRLTSISRESASVVVLQFDMGMDISDATSTVRDRMGPVTRELPSGVEAPVIRPIDFGALPIVALALSAPGGIEESRRIADDRVRPFLEQVKGVGLVNVVGGQPRQVQVELDLDRLKALQISPQQIVERIGIENRSLPVGQMDQSGFSVAVRAMGQYRTVADVRDTVVHQTRDGRQVRLGEVAQILDGVEDPERFVRFNGHEAVSLEVIKRSGANTVEVAHGIHEALEEILPTLGEGVVAEVVWDTSIAVEANAEEVSVAIWFGGAMAVVVILFFLLDVRGTIISALALPTSVIGTFAVMAALGFSLNTMTLLGLSLAIGLLIDDAVVVREAITHRLEQGDDPMTAARRGTAEIALAVLATTLSLVAVFVPVAFMSGIVGQFFWQFGITISVAVLLSLFVAFTLDPMLSSRFSKARVGPRRGLGRLVEWFLDGVDEVYRRILRVVVRWRFTTVFMAVLVLVCSGVVGSTIPGEFVPKEDRGDFFADLRLPVGTSIEVTEQKARSVEAELMAIPEVVRLYTVVGHEGQDYRARFRIQLVDKTERDEPQAWHQDKARQILQKVASSEVTISEPGLIEGLGGDYAPLQVILQGDDLDKLLEESTRVKGMLKAIPGTADVRTSVSPGQPELRVEIDRALAADRGVPAGLVGMTARTLVEGVITGTLQDGGEQADIRVRAAPQFRDDIDALKALPLPSPRGEVTLGDVAHVAMGAGPSEIQRTNRLRAVTVSAELAPGGALGDILETFQAGIAKDPLPHGYFYTIEGQAQDMQETADAMGFAIFVAMVCIYMVLASQFESLVHPFTLLVSVPLGMVGAIFALKLAGMSFSMGSQIGIILLAGLVAKNAILLIDGALQNMDLGMEALPAIEAAGPRRLRPIVMTSAAMVFGMVPTAIGTGVGAEFRAPMAVTVIGGVISSTILTLLVIPVIFLWVEWWRQKGMAAWSWLNGDRASAAPPKESPAQTPAHDDELVAHPAK